MTSTYVVTIETGTASPDDYKSADEALSNANVTIRDSMKREDGTAVYWLEWEPKPETYIHEGREVQPEDAAVTWNAAKASVENLRSVFAGVGLLVVECRIEEYKLSKEQVKADEAAAKAAAKEEAEAAKREAAAEASA